MARYEDDVYIFTYLAAPAVCIGITLATYAQAWRKRLLPTRDLAVAGMAWLIQRFRSRANNLDDIQLHERYFSIGGRRMDCVSLCNLGDGFRPAPPAAMRIQNNSLRLMARHGAIAYTNRGNNWSSHYRTWRRLAALALRTCFQSCLANKKLADESYGRTPGMRLSSQESLGLYCRGLSKDRRIYYKNVPLNPPGYVASENQHNPIVYLQDMLSLEYSEACV